MLRIRVPLGLVTNAIAYGSLYGRGEPADTKLDELKKLLEPYGVTIDDVRKAVKKGSYSVRRRS